MLRVSRRRPQPRSSRCVVGVSVAGVRQTRSMARTPVDPRAIMVAASAGVIALPEAPLVMRLGAVGIAALIAGQASSGHQKNDGPPRGNPLKAPAPAPALQT